MTGNLHDPEWKERKGKRSTPVFYHISKLQDDVTYMQVARDITKEHELIPIPAHYVDVVTRLFERIDKIQKAEKKSLTSYEISLSSYLSNLRNNLRHELHAVPKDATWRSKALNDYLHREKWGCLHNEEGRKKYKEICVREKMPEYDGDPLAALSTTQAEDLDSNVQAALASPAPIAHVPDADPQVAHTHPFLHGSSNDDALLPNTSPSLSPSPPTDLTFEDYINDADTSFTSNDSTDVFLTSPLNTGLEQTLNLVTEEDIEMNIRDFPSEQYVSTDDDIDGVPLEEPSYTREPVKNVDQKKRQETIRQAIQQVETEPKKRKRFGKSKSKKKNSKKKKVKKDSNNPWTLPQKSTPASSSPQVHRTPIPLPPRPDPATWLSNANDFHLPYSPLPFKSRRLK
ncbi:hypothetical protein FRC03_004694 [Tulasnella sp. 419]|nr:hypothetical protein FRC03_004694 [Tulasnella sp. 419]